MTRDTIHGAEQNYYYGVGDQELYVQCCYRCGVLFAFPYTLENTARRQTQDSDEPTVYFWCPNGHKQSYPGESKEQKLKRKLAQAQDRAGRNAHRAEQAEARRVAQKAATTRARKRHAAGVCPACKRSFQNVQRHMESQHPDYDPSVGHHEGGK